MVTAGWGQVNITQSGVPFDQDFENFDGLTDPINWVTSDAPDAAASTWQGQGTGSSSTGGKWSYGSEGDADRSLGFLPSSSRAIFADIAFANNTSETIIELDIDYVGEHWRGALDGRNNGWAVSYQIGAGDFIDIPELTFIAPNTKSTGALDGNDPANREIKSHTITGLNIPNGTEFIIRFYGDNGTGGGSRQGVAIDDFSLTATTGVVSVADPPTFDPPGGTYYEPIDVVLSTTTPNGVIYYTDDGTDPDDQSTPYTAPIPLSSTTTLKAITYADELEPSSISTATYTFPIEVNDVASLRAGTLGTLYKLTGEVVLTFQQSFRNQKYVQDNSAGILIDDDPGVITTTYQRDDGITGLIGTLTEFGNMLQFNPEVDPGPATSSGNTVVPVELTIAQFNADFETYEARLVKLLNVSFTETGTFTNGQVYGISDGLDAANFRCTFYDVDYIGTDIPQNVLHLIGLPNSRTDGDYITARDLNDFETPSDIAIDAGQSSLPQVFALHQNYPNPFNPSTAISYQLPEASEVQLIIYNLLGQKVTTLVGERQPAGHYTLQWDASGMVSGVYLYKLQTDNGFSQTRKLVLMK